MAFTYRIPDDVINALALSQHVDIEKLTDDEIKLMVKGYLDKVLESQQDDD